MGERWFDWFEGLSIRVELGDETLLWGKTIDQPALLGVLHISTR